MFSDINSVCGKYCCIYCRSHKTSYSEVESFFLENKARSHLEGGLHRDSTDWFHIKRSLYGINNDMLITIRHILSLYIHIRPHSFINSKLKANNFKTTIHCEVKNENFVKYKIQSFNFN
jgi:hypothetical protein